VDVPTWAPEIVGTLAYPAVFATVSGAHLYGFASVDSDLDLRGVHLLPLPELVGLRNGPETLEAGGERDGVELDVVTHELAKFCRLLLRPNGYVLEQLLSPLVVATSDLHAALVALVPGLLTSRHANHYLGFAAGQWALFTRTGELKSALYTLRVLLTGVPLMRTGEVEADLRRRHRDVGGPGYVPDLIAAKAHGEHRPLGADPDLPSPETIGADVARLRGLLESAKAATHLPDHPTCGDTLHDLVVAARLGT
jgi:uncharacterized protein